MQARTGAAVRIQLSTPVRPTEDPDKVADALVMFWPDAEPVLHDDSISATASELDTLRARVWELRIIDAFRRNVLPGAHERVLRFRIGKQAALAGQVAVPPTPHVLGDLTIVVELEESDPWPDAEHLVWWLCPETAEGEIIGRKEPPGSVPSS